MRLFFSIFLTIILSNSLFAIENPYKNINNSDKINALVGHFIQEEVNKLPKPPKVLNLKKGMFEKKITFEIRAIKEQSKYDSDIKNYKKQVNKVTTQVKNKALIKAVTIVYGVPEQYGKIDYDSESEHIFTSIKFKDGKTQKIAIKVPFSIAEKFYNNFNKITPKAIYKHTDSSLSLKSINYYFDGKTYEALFTNSKYRKEQVAIKIKSNYEIDTQIQSAVNIASYNDNPEIKRLNDALLKVSRDKLNETEIVRLKAKLAKAQNVNVAYVDDLPNLLKRIPQAKIDNKKWLFIIGIEKYAWTDDIVFSSRSAKMFKKVMKKSLGIPENNVYTLIDEKATLGSIRNRLKKMLRKVKDTDTVYFYYNGHGIPIPGKDNEPYMLASDIEPDYVADDKFFSLKNIYKTLSGSNAKKVVAFVDSCFSGGADGKTILKGVAATRLKPKKVNFDKSKMVVLSAGKDKQYSNAYLEKGHRLFSYFVMKSILEGKQDINSIHRNTYRKVKNTSTSEYGDLRVQHPTIDGNRELKL